ncbi:hypothetical protein Tco_0464479 [Tanacetum coccineum]
MGGARGGAYAIDGEIWGIERRDGRRCKSVMVIDSEAAEARRVGAIVASAAHGWKGNQLDLLQVIVLFAHALTDCHELLLGDDSWSIDSQIGDVVKYSLIKGLNRKSNSCSDKSVSVKGEQFGTRFELKGSLLWS